MDLRTDPRMKPPEKDLRRWHLGWSIVGNLFGMGMVALAFRSRWVTHPWAEHPFPVLLTFGSIVLLWSTRVMVLNLVDLWRERRGG